MSTNSIHEDGDSARKLLNTMNTFYIHKNWLNINKNQQSISKNKISLNTNYTRMKWHFML